MSEILDRAYLDHKTFEWAQLNPDTVTELDRLIGEEIPEKHRGTDYTIPWAVNCLYNALVAERLKNRNCPAPALRKALLNGLRLNEIDHPGSVDPQLHSSVIKRLMLMLRDCLGNYDIRIT